SGAFSPRRGEVRAESIGLRQLRCSASTRRPSVSALGGVRLVRRSLGEGGRAGENDYGLTVAAQVRRNQAPIRQLNPLVLQTFATNPPASMRDVAQRYGELLANA